jgi:putative inorganic carbon (hco3(-)) transporter
MRDIVLLSLLAVSLPICLARPFFGVVLWTLFAFLNPQSFTWGIARQASPALAIAIPTLVGFIFGCPDWKRLICRETILLFVLWLWFTATAYNANHEAIFADNAVATWYRWTSVSKILLMTVVTIGMVHTWNRLRWLMLTIAVSFGLMVLKTMPFLIMSGGEARLYGPSNSMIADNNDFGLALNMVVPFFFFLAKTETRPLVKKFMAFCFVASIPAIMFTYSRGAMLGLVAVLLCMLLQAKHKAVLIPVAVLALCFGAFFAPQSWRDRMSNTTDGALDASALSRINAWTFAWRVASDYPLMGGGFDDFNQELFDRYAPNPKDVHGPHSVYFGVLAEHGFIGLALYLTLIAMCLIALQRIVRKARRYGDLRALQYANLLRFALVGFLVSGSFLGRAYFDFYFTIVACVAVLRQVSQAEWRHYDEAEEPAEQTELSSWELTRAEA